MCVPVITQEIIDKTYCTSVIDKFYDGIGESYIKYIGKTLERVVKDLSITHIVEPYKLCDLQDSDVVLWSSRRDKMAHVTVYYNSKFYHATPEGVKERPVLVKYKDMLKPKYIVRLKEKVCLRG